MPLPSSDPAWRSALGEEREHSLRRRRAQSTIAALLRSDLYEPQHLLAEGNEVYWLSPLRWVVRFVVHPEFWEVVILRPTGEEYRRLRNPTVEDVEEVLP